MAEVLYQEMYPAFKELRKLWMEYLEHLRYGNGELSAFWMSYVDMVEDVVLGLLQASCEGKLELHQYHDTMVLCI